MQVSEEVVSHRDVPKNKEYVMYLLYRKDKSKGSEKVIERLFDLLAFLVKCLPSEAHKNKGGGAFRRLCKKT